MVIVCTGCHHRRRSGEICKTLGPQCSSLLCMTSSFCAGSLQPANGHGLWEGRCLYQLCVCTTKKPGFVTAGDLYPLGTGKGFKTKVFPPEGKVKRSLLIG